MLALILAGCGKQETTTVGFADDGTTVTIKQGSLLVLRLDADPEDFIWEIEGMDKQLLEIRKNRLIELETPSRFGGNTFREMIFLAAQTGQTRLKLEFTSLDEDNDVSDTFTVRIVIEK